MDASSWRTSLRRATTRADPIRAASAVRSQRPCRNHLRAHQARRNMSIIGVFPAHLPLSRPSKMTLQRITLVNGKTSSSDLLYGPPSVPFCRRAGPRHSEKREIGSIRQTRAAKDLGRRPFFKAAASAAGGGGSWAIAGLPTVWRRRSKTSRRAALASPGPHYRRSAVRRRRLSASKSSCRISTPRPPSSVSFPGRKVPIFLTARDGTPRLPSPVASFRASTRSGSGRSRTCCQSILRASMAARRCLAVDSLRSRSCVLTASRRSLWSKACMTGSASGRTSTAI